MSLLLKPLGLQFEPKQLRTNQRENMKGIFSASNELSNHPDTVPALMCVKRAAR